VARALDIEEELRAPHVGFYVRGFWGTWPVLSAAKFLDLRETERTSLEQFPWKHRNAEGAPGSSRNMGLGVLFSSSFLELTSDN